MKQYSIFDLNGKLVKSFQSTKDLEVPKDLFNKILIDKYVPPNTYYLDVSSKTLVPLGLRPSNNHIFDYLTKTWVLQYTENEKWVEVRDRRNELLQLSDWTQLPDVPLATKEAWASYRQALRDITDQSDPFNIVWPVPPN